MRTWYHSLIGVLLLLFLLQTTGLGESLDRSVTDLHWRLGVRQVRAFPDSVLVIGIDDRTVQQYGRLRYWSRGRYAALLDRLTLARAVALDILFTEPDRQDPAGDAALAAAVRRHGRVALPVHRWQEARPYGSEQQAREEQLLEKLSPATPTARGWLQAISSAALEPPLPELQKAAATLGFAEVDPDPDGVYRSPRLARVTAGRLLPHLSLAVALLAQRTDPALAFAGLPNSLQIGDRQIELPDGVLLLQPLARQPRARGRPGVAVPTLSFVEALQAPPERFAGKVVLVGETATGTTDLRPNALDPGLRGVELNAEIIANLLALPPVRPLPMAAQWGFLLVGVALPFCFYGLLPVRPAARAALGAWVAVWLGLEWEFWVGRYVPSWTPMLAGSGGAVLFMGLQRLLHEESEKRTLRHNFSLFVAPELVQAIVADPQAAMQEGTRQRVAVLFSDIRGFTSYSEQHPPEVVVRQMREYLTEMTDAVLDPSVHGVLDKFIGDAVMALFGPFTDEGANLSGRAVACALDMLARLQRLNERWRAEGLPEFRIGIGIHVGDAVVGNIGTPRRVQFTALGDTVNVAARLQTATKDLRATLLVSEAVREEAQPVFQSLVEFRDRGALAIRGREQALHVFELRDRGSSREGVPDGTADGNAGTAARRAADAGGCAEGSRTAAAAQSEDPAQEAEQH